MKVLLLLSAGIDSPVAGYLLKDKFDLLAIHFSPAPFARSESEHKLKQFCKKLNIKKLYIIKHGKNLMKIIKHCNPRYRCILCRRLMFKIAEKIAKKENYKYLITGENLGQVCSQTLDNLTLADKAVKIIILRPLLCYNKQETIDLAKKISTYQLSIESSVCCNAVPKNPATKAKENILLEEEKKLKNLIENSLKSPKIINI